MKEKRTTLVLVPLLAWMVLAVVVIWPWMHQFDQKRATLSTLAHINAAIWWIVLLWALHHLTFQLSSLLSSSPTERPRHDLSPPSIAILCPTCDDFDEECCLSCVEQDYDDFQVYILDDSRSVDYRRRTARFAEAHSDCHRVARSDRRGFKAGNINHALREHVTAEWFLLVDADQRLPRDFTRKLVERALLSATEDTVFIQAAHHAFQHEDNSAFQRALGPEVSIFYERDLGPSARFGFVSLLGHGALIRKADCLALGGFPEVVSEDFAFALRVGRDGKRGVYAEDVASAESYPYDFGAFMTRLKKFASGSAELLKHEVPEFLKRKSKATRVEKWDFAMAMLWYVLMPLLVLNSFLGAYVVHALWSSGVPYLHPVLPYLYTWLLAAVFAVILSTTRDWRRAVRFYFWSTAIYTASLPVSGWSFLYHLFCRAGFERTPKGRKRTAVSSGESMLTALLGVAAIACGLAWLSPFSPVIIGQGVAYLSYRLYADLCSESVTGRIARASIWLPGLLYLFALYAVWRWAW